MQKQFFAAIRKHGIWIVLFCALLLRLYAIEHVPPSPSLDEVSLGYNAYSILRTGMDEFGTRYPIILRAYDDFRPALYVYAVAPMVAVFGLTPLAVRLPSVLLSLASIWGSYMIVKTWFLLYWQQVKTKRFAEEAALGTALLLAISPWHIYLSRLGHEVNLGLASVIISILVFFRALSTKRFGWLILSACTFGLAFYSYQSEKVVVPLVLLALGMLFLRELWKTKRTELIISLLVGFILVTPMTVQSLSKQGMLRYTATSAFTEGNPIYARDRQNFVAAKTKGNIVGQLLAYPKFSSLKIFLGNYFSHFNIGWLFFGGQHESHKVPNLGLLYVWEFPFIVIGIWLFLKSPFPGKLKWFVTVWFLSAAVPAAITTQAPHAMRSLTFLPLWQFFSAYAAAYLIARIQWPVIIGLTVAVMASIISFNTNYFRVFPVTQSDSFQFPLSQALPVVFELEDGYKHIVVSNEDALYQSYMFYLFNRKYDPKMYLKMGGTVSGGFAEKHSIGKYEFRPLHPGEKMEPDVLYVGNPQDFNGGTTVREFTNLAGQTRVVVKTL